MNYRKAGQKRTGGGVVFYINDPINYKVVDNLPEHSLELMCSEIIPKQAHSFFVLCWYRPPALTVDKFDELVNILGYLETFNRKIILLRDTNSDLLSVETGTGSTAEHMRNLYSDFGKKQLSYQSPHMKQFAPAH